MNKILFSVVFTIFFLVFVGSQEVFGGVPMVIDPDFKVETIVSGLDLPTTMDFLGTDDILVLQKNDGKVMRVLSGMLQANPVLDVSVVTSGERGLLGIAIVKSPPSTFVYLYLTELSNDGITPVNRVYKYTWNSSTGLLESPMQVLELPSPHRNHNGGVLAIGLGNEIFAIMGDGNENGILQNFPSGAPDDTSVIIPVDPVGPYKAIGIRNSFGLTVDPVTGFLWDTENGPSEFDEINFISSNFNSGWETVMGPGSLCSGPTAPSCPLAIAGHGTYLYSEPEFSWRDTNAPTAISFIDTVPFFEYKDFAFVGDNNAGQIYAFPLNANRDGFDFSSFPTLVDLVADNNAERDLLTFGSGFGVITDIKVGPDGNFYVVSLSMGKIFKIAPISQTDTKAVGGEVLPIATTSLILAGAQTFSWIIPIVLSAVGIGLVLVRKRQFR